jgi:RimJ/RimL family protein N-acetyltransferase
MNAGDIEDLLNILNNPVVATPLYTLPAPYLKSDAVKWIEFVEAEKVTDPKNSRLRFAIRETRSKRLVGTVSVGEKVEGWKLGYWLAEEHWNRGVMTWACSEALKCARKEGIRKVSTSVLEGNWGSRRVLEKNKFVLLGTVRGVHHEELADQWEFEINLSGDTD